MGAAVGQCLTSVGHEVLWASEGRGPQTAARARAAGLTDVGTAAEMAERAEVILSICPPHAALDTAWAAQGFGGLYVDANAISPATAREVALMVEEGGATYVDGGIIGQPPPAGPYPPPHSPSTVAAHSLSSADRTRLYLSGGEADAVRQLFDGTAVDARVIGGGPWSASAVKMAYAAWTKGTAALLLTARALARAEGVEDALLAEWAMSQPSLAERSRGAARSATTKGWRWVAEMEEIATSMAAAGLPDGFHQAAAEIFRRSPRAEPDADVADAVEWVLSAITGEAIRG
jgi:3-hydroxyisobutyrate dehydrogenase-like beta-hydroxyacid dehydrogenase